MTTNQSATAAERLWRMSAGKRLQYALLALFIDTMGAIAGIGAIAYERDVLIGVLALIAAAVASGVFWLPLRCFVLLKPSALVIRTPMRISELGLHQIGAAREGRNGLVVTASDGRVIQVPGTSWTDWSTGDRRTRLSYTTRQVADVINRAVKASTPSAAE